MKEFIENLIGRLEERKEFHSSLIAYEQKNGTITEEYQQRKAVDVLDNAIEIVNQIAEEHKGGWILVSERLPSESERWIGNDITDAEPREFIVMVKGGYVPTTGYYTVDGWVKDIYDKENRSGYANEIIAWRPFPEPYQSKED